MSRLCLGAPRRLRGHASGTIYGPTIINGRGINADEATHNSWSTVAAGGVAGPCWTGAADGKTEGTE